MWRLVFNISPLHLKLVSNCFNRFQDLMDFLQPQQDVLSSFYTRQQFLILQNELGSRVPTLWFYKFYIYLFLTVKLLPLIEKLLIDTSELHIHSSRAASHGIVLADSQSDDAYNDNAPGSGHVQSLVETHLSSSTSRGSISFVRRLKENLNRLWLFAVQRWPTVQLSLDMFLIQVLIYAFWIISWN